MSEKTELPYPQWDGDIDHFPECHNITDAELRLARTAGKHYHRSGILPAAIKKAWRFTQGVLRIDTDPDYSRDEAEGLGQIAQIAIAAANPDDNLTDFVLLQLARSTPKTPEAASTSRRTAVKTEGTYADETIAKAMSLTEVTSDHRVW